VVAVAEFMETQLQQMVIQVVQVAVAELDFQQQGQADQVHLVKVIMEVMVLHIVELMLVVAAAVVQVQ
jgi:hypothetical protein